MQKKNYQEKTKALLDLYVSICMDGHLDDAQIIDSLVPIFSKEELEALGYGSFVKEYFKDDEPMTAIRDNLISTMACRAGVMDGLGHIALDGTVDGEDRLAKLCAETVDRWLQEQPDYISYDEYIETALLQAYGTEKPQRRPAAALVITCERDTEVRFFANEKKAATDMLADMKDCGFDAEIVAKYDRGDPCDWDRTYCDYDGHSAYLNGKQEIDWRIFEIPTFVEE